MQAYIGLGSNLAEPVKQVQSAIADLQSIPSTSLIKASSLYSSAPMGPQDQPDYVNAVALLETELSAHALLDALQAIEQQHGRERKRHWGERTLDLDILLFGEEMIEDERLVVPHIGLHEREFVVYPLMEIAGDITIPGKDSLKAIAAKCPRGALEKLEQL
ncbi:2-amino-4-hydroxy-6-hydroxymethyldihydropteridine diphosphokinase [Methylophaga sp. OBS3]|uniref:2-amino-4-hydroxy-6- hydroxymethyldihydropteridine diphosphokinase n=1 Tax=Methylophaga sp. OBS3 TaxID=2991934 RepID=UPI0022506703|nr:2-amino-4-hydroxy-6-hydroxymethyldihydropteridine diphosphokinase [Methylophaga sp. OBS3]MCX4189493.1 2-amino-4-hydroxy-6-hydroxymethyldihydropteridine diphosphokinase [Methylophaga sp. OBS3]